MARTGNDEFVDFTVIHCKSLLLLSHSVITLQFLLFNCNCIIVVFGCTIKSMLSFTGFPVHSSAVCFETIFQSESYFCMFVSMCECIYALSISPFPKKFRLRNLTKTHMNRCTVSMVAFYSIKSVFC